MKKLLNLTKTEALKAKTKYDMCYLMTSFSWRNLPWLNMMSLSKSEIRDAFDEFILSTFKFDVK